MTETIETLGQILKEYDGAYAEFNGYTVNVSEHQTLEADGYWLSIQKEAMPPHFNKFCATLEEVEQEMAHSFFPQPIQWQPVRDE